MPDIPVEDYIRQEAQKQGVPPDLALAVASKESNFFPGAKGSSGELGVMQLMPATATRYKVNAADPYENIQGGIHYLKDLMDRYQGDPKQVLAAYNAGEGRAQNPPASTQAYVQDVLGRTKQYQVSATEQAATPTKPAAPVPTTAGAPPAPKSRLDIGRQKAQAAGIWTPPPTPDLAGFDPRSEQGRRNLAGAAGAIALNEAVPEAPIFAAAFRFAKPIVGAYLAGGAEKGAEQVAGGGPPTLAAMHEAGTQQAGQEAIGQAGAWLPTAVLRRITAGPIAKQISERLGNAIDAAKESVAAVESRVKMTRPSVTPSEAGRAVEQVAYGPAKTVKDAVGQTVEQTAKEGPPVDLKPVKAQIQEMVGRMTPAAEQAPAVGAGSLAALRGEGVGTKANPELMAAMAELQGQHPVSGVMGQLAAEPDTIPFSEAHKYKRMMDEAVNWDSPAKKQIQQITKGTRQALRDQMDYGPYNEANERYAQISDLYTKPVQTLHREILTNPEGIVQKMSWKNPSTVKMLKELTVDVPKQGADWTPVTRATAPGIGPLSDKAETWFVHGHLPDAEAQNLRDLYTRGGTVNRGYIPSDLVDLSAKMTDENGHTLLKVPTEALQAGNFRQTPPLTGAQADQGEAAWNALRASWTHENLVTKGPKGMLDTIGKMEASGNGQEFLQTMYGDDQGKLVLQNLKNIGQAFQDAQARVGGAEETLQQFAKTRLAGAPPPTQVLADVAAIGLHGHPIYKARAASRLLWGPKTKELVQWAATSGPATQFLINHVLASPEPGMALADMYRWYKGDGEGEPSAPPLAPVAGSPPQPTSSPR